MGSNTGLLPEVLVIVIVLPLVWLAVLTWLMASLALRLRDLARRDELHHVASEIQSKASRADLSTLQADFARLDAGIERLSERTAHLVDRLDSIHDILMKRP
jgi:cell division protein FtsB